MRKFVGLLTVLVLLPSMGIVTAQETYHGSQLIQRREIFGLRFNAKTGEQMEYHLSGTGAECWYYLITEANWKSGTESWWRTSALKKGLLNEHGEFNKVSGWHTFRTGDSYVLTFANQGYSDVVTVTWEITINPAAKTEPTSVPTNVGDVVIVFGGIIGLLILAGIAIWYRDKKKQPKTDDRYFNSFTPTYYGCPACGFKINPGDRFCGNCGKPLK